MVKLKNKDLDHIFEGLSKQRSERKAKELSEHQLVVYLLETLSDTQRALLLTHESSEIRETYKYLEKELLILNQKQEPSSAGE